MEVAALRARFERPALRAAPTAVRRDPTRINLGRAFQADLPPLERCAACEQMVVYRAARRGTLIDRHARCGECCPPPDVEEMRTNVAALHALDAHDGAWHGLEVSKRTTRRATQQKFPSQEAT